MLKIGYVWNSVSVLVTKTEVALKYKIFKIKEYTFSYVKLVFPRSLKAILG